MAGFSIPAAEHSTITSWGKDREVWAYKNMLEQYPTGLVEQNFTKYTPSGGTMELRQAICKRHAADFGTAFTAAECVVSVGGKHAIFNLMQVLIDPGDEVVVPVPYWVTFKDVVNFAGGKCTFV